MNALKSLSNATGRLGLQIEKHSPELLLGAGILSFAGTIILACKATTKMSQVLEKHNEELEMLKNPEKIEEKFEEQGEIYDEEDLKRDKIIVYKDVAIDTLKVWGPTIGVGLLSIGCFLGSYKILNGRYVGAIAAYNVVQTAFSKYRGRVIEEMGDQMDRHFRYGTDISEIETTVDNGDGKKPKTEKTKCENIISSDVSDYARFFDRTCPEWDENPMYNLKWLRANESAANDILNSRGHIFLNEVYDMIGLPHTTEGAVVGWVKGNGDGYVDFGLYDPNNESATRLVNGQDNVVLLDFNVDGIIFDKI